MPYTIIWHTIIWHTISIYLHIAFVNSQFLGFLVIIERSLALLANARLNRLPETTCSAAVELSAAVLWQYYSWGCGRCGSKSSPPRFPNGWLPTRPRAERAGWPLVQTRLPPLRVHQKVGATSGLKRFFKAQYGFQGSARKQEIVGAQGRSRSCKREGKSASPRWRTL